MNTWRPQTYRHIGEERGIDPTVLANAIATGQATLRVHRNLPPVFSLRHLAHLADVDYGFLRAIVSRDLSEPYKVFRIRKRSGGHGEQRFRTICVPDPELMRVQRWINARILPCAEPNSAITAYAKGSSIYRAAEAHCRCKWMIKLDIVNFFESISEIPVYRVFRGLGYQPLVSFELTRVCTRLGTNTLSRRRRRWNCFSRQHFVIRAYVFHRMGHLPQGAPTSPMLANLAVRDFDVKVSQIADRHGLVYTRYADDLTLSTDSKTFSRERVGPVIEEIYEAMVDAGLSPNTSKTHVLPPGARKVVLGLLVDRDEPYLPRAFKANLRQHLYYLRHPAFGPAAHAVRRKFVSVVGLRHHVEGLIAFAQQIEPSFAAKCAADLSKVDWPL